MSRMQLPDNAPASEPMRARVRVRRNLAAQAPEAIAALARLDAGRRLRECATFIALAGGGVLLGGYALRLHATALLLLAIVLTALPLNTFPLLVHEGMHRLLLPGRIANWLGSTLFASSFFMSYTAYRIMHSRHHQYLGDPRDPDEYNNYTRSRWLVWLMHCVRLSCGSVLYIVLIPAMALRFANAVERRLMLVEYALLLALWSIVLHCVAWPHLVLLWLVPMLLVGLLTQIRGFAEHGITDPGDPYLASRIMLPHRAVAFFLLNQNLHLEHHLFPEVPSYHLPALHRVLWPRLPRAVVNRSYLDLLGRFLSATPRLDETPIGLIHPAGPPSA